ncbi:hypothetical protein E2562_030144 [Oryza meyeriana var. granulata]|uniref:DUF6598 domain-containing protein n=1 Tax=Oryza meyeriana var. granulata TaxID=110450 RepID=A0A6G1BQI7_9ORYZ|nr:hypothetical protein E2562_030144 [Oryza meyeriana var. granulata]
MGMGAAREDKFLDEEEDFLDDEEAELIMVQDFHRGWEHRFSPRDAFEDTTTVRPMRYTEGPIPRYACCDEALQIFSLRVIEGKDGLDWPLHLWLGCHQGPVEQKCNLLFKRTRDNCQILTPQTGAGTGKLSRSRLSKEVIEMHIERNRQFSRSIWDTPPFVTVNKYQA